MKILKKLLLGFTTVMVMAVLCAVCAGAETNGTFDYNVLADGSIGITGYNGNDVDVVIPSEINGISVTSIEDEAFYKKMRIRSITIPAGVRNIGKNAFYSCTSLISFNVAAGNPNFYTADDVLFSKDKVLISYPSDKETESYSVPDGTVSIADWAFYWSTYLTELTIPDSVTSIGAGAFALGTSLQKINISSSVNNIGEDAFLSCYSLVAIDVAADNPYYYSVDGVLFSKDKVLITYPGEKQTAVYTIPNGTSGIAKNAFRSTAFLKEVIMPDSVTDVGERIFYNSEALEKITISKNLKTISYGFADHCESLKELIIPEGVTTIEECAFQYCTQLKAVTVPNTVESIGIDVFYNCSALAEAVIPSGVTYIGMKAFTGCADNFTIRCDLGSYAQSYAESNGLNYRKLIVAPAGVTGLAVSNRSDNSVTLSWAKTDPADGYYIQMLVGDTWEYVADIADNSVCTYKITGLASGTAHNMRVCAYNMDAGMARYSEFSVIEAITCPGDVSGVAMSEHTSDSISITWNKVEPADGYVIFKLFDGQTVVAGHSLTNSFTATGLEAGTEYGFIVQAFKTFGSKSYYSEHYTTVMIPTRPNDVTGVVMSANTKNSITVSWNKAEPADGYVVYMLTDGSWEVAGLVTSNTYTATGLEAGTEYSFLVKAYVTFGNTSYYSGYFYTVTMKTFPEKVTGLQMTENSDTSVNLNWTKVEGAAKYEIIRYNKGKYELLATVGTGTTSVTVKSLTNYSKYAYLIRAVAEDGTTALSEALWVTPAKTLEKPVVTATAGDKSAQLSWTAVEGAKYYQIIRYNGGKYTLVANIGGTSANVLGLTNNYKYAFLVAAVAEDGTKSLSTAVWVTPAVQLSKPAVTATAGDKSAQLSWTAVEGAKYYQIIRYNGGKYTLVANISGTSANVLGLTNNYKYAFLVAAVAEDGTKSLSTAVWVTPAVQLSKPVVTATAGDKGAYLSWNKVDGATSYQIIRYNKGVYQLLATVGPNTTSVTAKSLTNNYNYAFLIAAVAEDGTKSLSTAVWVTPKA